MSKYASDGASIREDETIVLSCHSSPGGLRGNVVTAARLAAQLERAERMEAALRRAEDTLVYGVSELPLDWLGTGSSQKFADKQEREWNDRLDGDLSVIRAALALEVTP